MILKNNVDQFSFNEANLKKLPKIFAKYPKQNKKSAILSLLDLAQRQMDGWIPQSAIEYVAEILELPAIRVYEVATFYTMFNLTPVGKYHIQICGTIPCCLVGAEELKYAATKIIKNLNIDEKLFTVSEVECLGACVNAPIAQINDDYYENLTIESLTNIIKDLNNKSLC